jgi:erythromycin esterase
VHPVGLTAESDGDLGFLRTLLGDARIVQLGENGHGAAEAMRLRARIAGYLCETLGFSVLAFESSLFLCHLANAREKPDPRQMLTSSVVGVWHTAQVLPLFELIARSRAGSRPIQLAGFDVQPIGGGRRRRPAFFGDLLTPVDAAYARAVVALDTEFLDAYDGGASKRREYFRLHGPRLISAYNELARFIDDRRDALQRHAGAFVPGVARQEALSMAAYVGYQSASEMRAFAETRDEAMFRNLRFLAEEQYPASKIVVWGHNYHLRHDNAAIPPSADIFPGVSARSMGTWTRQHFGARVFTVGQYEAAGTAFDNSRKPYTISPPPEGTLEHRLHRLAAGPAVIDIRTAARSSDGAWLGSRIQARYNGQHPEVLVPTNQYDAVLMLPEVTPPTFLN